MYCPVCGYVDGEHAKTVCPFCNHELKDSDHLLKEMKGKRPWAIEPIAEDIVQQLLTLPTAKAGDSQFIDRNTVSPSV